MPVNNLNFIPDSVTQVRKVRQSKVLGTRFTLALAVIAAIISGGLWFYNYTVDQKINQIKSEISQKQADILSMRDIGEDGYKLGARLTHAQTIVDTRQQVSLLMEQIRAHTPADIDISSWNFMPGQTVSFDGTSKGGYVVVDDFRKDLLKALGSNEKPIFLDVNLTNASFEKDKGIIIFKMTGKVNSVALYGTAK